MIDDHALNPTDLLHQHYGTINTIMGRRCRRSGRLPPPPRHFARHSTMQEDTSTKTTGGNKGSRGISTDEKIDNSTGTSGASPEQEMVRGWLEYLWGPTKPSITILIRHGP
jgi:hypothetical protein